MDSETQQAIKRMARTTEQLSADLKVHLGAIAAQLQELNKKFEQIDGVRITKVDYSKQRDMEQKGIKFDPKPSQATLDNQTQRWDHNLKRPEEEAKIYYEVADPYEQ